MAKTPPMQTEVTPLDGGVDMVTTPAKVKPGKLISSINYEPDVYGGYKRIKGIERFDGSPKPSEADYYVFDVDLTGSISEGDTITGATSGESSVVIKKESDSRYIGTKTTGLFTAGEDVEVSSVSQGTVIQSSKNSATTNNLDAQYKYLAAEEYRSDIDTVPGSGPVRGVKYFKGNVYAIRDNAGETAGVIHKQSSSGWSAMSFGREIQFINATGEIFEGDSVTGGTSGATATVVRSLLRSGTWSSNGAGTLTLESVTGAFVGGENLEVSVVSKATSSTVDTAITIPPGGKYDIILHNFFANTDNLRMYLVNGVGEALEFDGTNLTPIRTGVTSAYPKFISVIKNHLVLAIESSLNISGTGKPYQWDALVGAAELGLGDNCTGLLVQKGSETSGSMVATTKTKILILYGNDANDFNLVTHSPESGGLPYTLQNIGFAHFMDTKGLTQLQATQAFGGFRLSVLTQSVQPFIDSKLGKESASCIVRSSNQYRIFYNDGTGLICQILPNSTQYSTSLGSAMPFEYSNNEYYVNVTDTYIDETGEEHTMLGASNGYVYEMSKGTSIDGLNIGSFIMTTFNNSRSHRTLKRYRRTILQMRAESTASFNVGYDLTYGNRYPGYGDSLGYNALATGGYWDSFIWDSFTWDSAFQNDINVYTPGSGENISVIVSGDSAIDETYTIHTCINHYTLGRVSR